MPTLSARTLTSLRWRGILARERAHVVAASGRGAIGMHGGLEATAGLEQRPEHHGEMTPAHFGLRRLRILRQPGPRLVVLAVGQQLCQPMIQLLLGGARPALRP